MKEMKEKETSSWHNERKWNVDAEKDLENR